MSWSDPIRQVEPAEDIHLRVELRDLLGLGPAVPSAPVPVSAELAALAEHLRQEAQRRVHTQRHRPSWRLLAAAALPLLATLAGLGGWGLHQKQRADGLALHTQRQEQELSRLAATHAFEVARERQAKEQVLQQLQLVAKKGGRRTEPYLVIPIEKPVRPMGEEHLRVKQPPR